MEKNVKLLPETKALQFILDKIRPPKDPKTDDQSDKPAPELPPKIKPPPELPPKIKKLTQVIRKNKPVDKQKLEEFRLKIIQSKEE